MTDLKLTENFVQASVQDWQDLVKKGLKGANLDSLARLTEDELTRGPLSTSKDCPSNIAALPRSEAPLLEGRPWHIIAPVRDSDISYANKQLLEDLRGGASALRLTLGDEGVPIKNANDMKRLLDQVYTHLIPIIISPSDNSKILEALKDYKATVIYLGLSPQTKGLADIADAIPENWHAVTINAAQIHDDGGTHVQELAYFAAQAAQTYRRLGDKAARNISLEITTDQDGHLGIAKLRAARRIYARIAESFGFNQAPLPIHAITSQRMMQSVDPWTNMLRIMSAGFAAVIGGADFITTRPFTDGLGHATDFGHRIARNMQLMMMEESHLGQVKDAAYGSYFHERLTESLSQAAWVEFQQIEKDGGIENTAPFETRIKKAVQTREAREEPILGVTLHPAENLRKAKIRKVRS